jgi:uncharacterized protein YdaU (DUF1376 family)
MTTPMENDTATRRKLFYQKLFWHDFFGDTMHMNGLEKGAYLLLIGNYFMNRGPLPDDDTRLALMTSLSLEQWRAIRPALERRFEVRDRLWRHQATERAITEATTEYEARRRGGRLTRAKLQEQRDAEFTALCLTAYPPEQRADQHAKHPADQRAEQHADHHAEQHAEHPAQPTQLQLQPEPLPPTSLDVPAAGFGPVTPAEEEELLRRTWELIGKKRMYQRDYAGWRLLLYDHPAAFREALKIAESRKKEAVLGLTEPQSWSMYLSQTFKHIKKTYQRAAPTDPVPPIEEIPLD